ncbi:hypothetical protein SmJEL517_g04957 [Synchytrium microbalum]|uniref:Nickel/cobalt efflux system n=1 Tax=Synchytrium microbalum TaxID=1806994 RepID=A0A507BXF9_9FUNG|nr:uncharacterized protein SmJEL517_g04957 [Synchytrium microbalum]TPX31781.1 hypothetical protein SmJEL517_g04957 [Synchytrium microbalum]
MNKERDALDGDLSVSKESHQDIVANCANPFDASHSTPTPIPPPSASSTSTLIALENEPISGKADTSSNELSPSASKLERTRVLIIIGVLILVNVVLWITSIALSSIFSTLLVSNLLLAYTLGLRHALDADHITAIDNVTRKLLDDGIRPMLVGFYFSLGHSSIVVAATIAVAITATAIASQFENFQQVSSIIGTSFSGAVLLIIGLINLISLISIAMTIKRHNAGSRQDDVLEKVSVDDVMKSMGVWSRVLRPAFRAVDQSWKMYIVGLIFGLGFDTATEITLLSLASVQAAAGFPLPLIILYPLLFTAGMVLVDTLDGILMMRVYSASNIEPMQRLYFSFAVTLFSVTLALIIGIVQILSVIQSTQNLEGGFWDFLGGIQENFGLVGAGIIVVFIVVFLIIMAIRKSTDSNMVVNTTTTNGGQNGHVVKTPITPKSPLHAAATSLAPHTKPPPVPSTVNVAKLILDNVVRAFLTGYAISVLPTVLSAAFNQLILRKKAPAKQVDPLHIHVGGILVSSLQARLPWFLVVLIGGFRISDILLNLISTRFFNNHHAIHDAAAPMTPLTPAPPPPAPQVSNTRLACTFVASAGAAGAALLVIPPERRTDFALLACVRAADSFLKYKKKPILNALKRNGVPDVLIDNGDTLLFVTACTEIMWSWFYHPYALPKSYVKWISTMSELDPIVHTMLQRIYRGELVYNQDGPYNRVCMDFANKLGLPESLGDASKGFINCTLVHQGVEGCVNHTAKRWRCGFERAFRLYLPVHLLPVILFHPSRFSKPKELPNTLWKILFGATQSSVFLASFIALVWSPICFSRNNIMKGRDRESFGIFMGCFLSGFSLLLERKSRRREIALFVVPKAIESAWRRAWPYRGLDNGALRHSDVVIFAIAMGYIFTGYMHLQGSVRAPIRALMGWFVGKPIAL